MIPDNVALPLLQFLLRSLIVQDFCTFCCTENIRDVYGDESTEMETFSDTILQLEEEEEGFIIDPNNKPLEDESGDDNLIDT